MEVNWSTPPEGKPKHKLFVSELQKRPNEWALWRTATYASSAYVLTKSYPGIQTTIRNAGKNAKGTNLYDIYVMWAPDAT